VALNLVIQPDNLQLEARNRGITKFLFLLEMRFTTNTGTTAIMNSNNNHHRNDLYYQNLITIVDDIVSSDLSHQQQQQRSLNNDQGDEALLQQSSPPILKLSTLQKEAITLLQQQQYTSCEILARLDWSRCTIEGRSDRIDIHIIAECYFQQDKWTAAKEYQISIQSGMLFLQIG
jgi:hypothetical protein